MATGATAWALPEAAGDARMKYSELGAMSEEQLKAFLEAAKDDAGLQEQLKAAGDADAVVAIAKAAGFAITADDLTRAWTEREISEEELEVVQGGLIDAKPRTKRTCILYGTEDLCCLYDA